MIRRLQSGFLKDFILRWSWSCCVAVFLGGCGISSLQVFSDDLVQKPFEGITILSKRLAQPRPVNLHLVLIDLQTPGLAFKLSSGGGSLDAVRQTTLDFLNQEDAQLAINVHFFVPFPSIQSDVQLVGLAVSEGRLISPFEPQPVSPGYADQSYAIVPYGPAINLDRSNRVSLVFADLSRTNQIRPRGNPSLWTAFGGSAQIIRNGENWIPRYTGEAGGLRPGKTYNATNSWYELPRARTVAGFTADGKTLVLLVADEGGQSKGMTVSEAAALLIRDHEVSEALNLDGGGSSTLVIEDAATGRGRILNRPSDGRSGRSVGSSLAVFARKAGSR